MFPHRSPREQIGLWALGGLFVLGIGYVGAVRLRQPAPISIQSVAYTPGELAGSGKAPFPVTRTTDKARLAATPSEPIATEVVVDVAGAVKHPGVEHLAPGARVEQAIKAAGGAATNADLEKVNQAAKLTDGEMIRIPRRGETSTEPVFAGSPPPLKGQIGGGPVAAEPASIAKSRRGGGKAPASPVSLNSASAEELETLPGVGPATAQKIIDYRIAHGAFSSVEELGAVGGLGEKKLAKLLPYVRL